MMWSGQKSSERVGIARIKRAQHRPLHCLDEQSPVVAMQRDLRRVTTDAPTIASAIVAASRALTA